MQFESLREHLLRAGVTPRRVRRYLAELDNHLTDLIKQEQVNGYNQDEAVLRARVLLGSDAELAQGWLQDTKLKSLTTRAPWLVFVLVQPFAALLVVLTVSIPLAIVGLTHGLFQRHAVTPPDWFHLLTQTVATTTNLIVVPTIAALFVAIAWRQRLAIKWPLIGTAVMAVLFVHIDPEFPYPGHHKGFGAGFMPLYPFVYAEARLAAQWPSVLAQWFLTLLPALWLVTTAQKRVMSGEP